MSAPQSCATNAPPVRARQLVHPAREHLLAGAGLPFEQHRHPVRRHHLRQLQHPPHPRAVEARRACHCLRLVSARCLPRPLPDPVALQLQLHPPLLEARPVRATGVVHRQAHLLWIRVQRQRPVHAAGVEERHHLPRARVRPQDLRKPRRARRLRPAHHLCSHIPSARGLLRLLWTLRLQHLHVRAQRVHQLRPLRVVEPRGNDAHPVRREVPHQLEQVRALELLELHAQRGGRRRSRRGERVMPPAHEPRGAKASAAAREAPLQVAELPFLRPVFR